jgi:hypothetical protein
VRAPAARPAGPTPTTRSHNIAPKLSLAKESADSGVNAGHEEIDNHRSEYSGAGRFSTSVRPVTKCRSASACCDETCANAIWLYLAEHFQTPQIHPFFHFRRISNGMRKLRLRMTSFEQRPIWADFFSNSVKWAQFGLILRPTLTCATTVVSDPPFAGKSDRRRAVWQKVVLYCHGKSFYSGNGT